MFNIRPQSLIMAILAWTAALGAAAPAEPSRPPQEANGGTAPQGLVFTCSPDARARLPKAMVAYLRELDIDPHWIVRGHLADDTLSFTLATPATSETDTLSLSQRPGYRIRDEQVILPGPQGKSRRVTTVSRKEILLALLHPGRQTQFSGKACDIQALREHVGVRQNVVAWTEELHWRWPDGGPARWNSVKWQRGTPRSLSRLDDALLDAFVNQRKYMIGCYTASKLSYAHAVLGYYARVRKDAVKAAVVRERLLHDKEPLVHVEPADAWDFEPGFKPETGNHPGKLLTLLRGVPPRHFVPGDWAYILNTDPATYQKTGYEGSNSIYLGRGRFDDFYDDHRHAYSLEEKLDEVYQWRHGVFSRARDAARVQPLSAPDLERLVQPPAQGGLLLDLRMVPYLFGYQPLPSLPQSTDGP